MGLSQRLQVGVGLLILERTPGTRMKAAAHWDRPLAASMGAQGRERRTAALRVPPSVLRLDAEKRAADEGVKAWEYSAGVTGW